MGGRECQNGGKTGQTHGHPSYPSERSEKRLAALWKTTLGRLQSMAWVQCHGCFDNRVPCLDLETERGEREWRIIQKGLPMPPRLFHAYMTYMTYIH